MIGIIGYGFLGKALDAGFPYIQKIISDPKYNSITIKDVVEKDPLAIFVCIPTPTDETRYEILLSVLDEITSYSYSGIVVVKSTILPYYIEKYDIVLNPEFLSRKTAYEDFVNPPFLLLGGDPIKTQKVYQIYKDYSCVNLDKVKFTDIKTASLAKYTFNTFYATKLIFMNEIYDVANKMGVDFNELKDILKMNPWVGSNHLDVPGHEGRGFSGPCLPKDTEALSREFNIELLQKVLEINERLRR